MYPVKISQVKLKSGFWNDITAEVRGTMIPFQWEALNDRVESATPSFCIANFRLAAGETEGEYGGYVFQDSDLAKWLEAAACSLASHPDQALEETLDNLIDLIGRAQQDDGYLNTYYTVKEPGKRYVNLRDCHELYCAGHMMEAAVAYYEMTGKRKLMDIMLRMAHHIHAAIGLQEGKLRGYPGHEEIELALVKMYRATGDKSLLDLAVYFINERGASPCFFETEHNHDGTTKPAYFQAHLPVRSQTTMEGHSVRALYLLAGMADIARETNDTELFSACEKLFDNVSEKRMYITGGVGSTSIGEAFSFDYDLPNDTAYAETCASIALVFASQRLLNMTGDSRYADVMERALYNTCIAGKSLDGCSFFYVNPLEVLPEASFKDPGKKHVLPVRPPWFGCACCPPNLARLMMSLGQYLYSADSNHIYVHLYADSEAVLMHGEHRITIRQETEYPFSGHVVLTVSQGCCALNLRKPEWCENARLYINGEPYEAPLKRGYWSIERHFREGDTVILDMDMPPRRVYTHPRVIDGIGKVAFARGPIIFCAEEKDNGAHLNNVFIRRDAPITDGPSMQDLRGFPSLTVPALRQKTTDAKLYRDTPVLPDQPVTLTLIPYFAWANRGVNEMLVWLREWHA
jgi:DUF1680 family protein